MTTIPEGYAQVNLYFTGSSVPLGAQMTFGIQNAAFTAADACLAVNDSLDDSNIEPLLNGSIGIRKVRVKNGPNDDGDFAELSVVHDGTASGPPTSPNVCYLLKKNTELGGRRGRGRMYLPGCQESVVDAAGALTSAFVTALDASMALMLASLDTNSIPMVLLHGPATAWVLNEDGQPRREEVAGTVPTPSPVTSISTDPLAATQRRRMRG